jgi:hypothetical protein
MPERALRVGLAAVLLLSGIKLVDLPHGNAVLVIAAFGVASGFTAWGLSARSGRRRSVETAA